MNREWYIPVTELSSPLQNVFFQCLSVLHATCYQTVTLFVWTTVDGHRENMLNSPINSVTCWSQHSIWVTGCSSASATDNAFCQYTEQCINLVHGSLVMHIHYMKVLLDSWTWLDITYSTTKDLM
jgi:hypothetical protein